MVFFRLYPSSTGLNMSRFLRILEGKSRERIKHVLQKNVSHRDFCRKGRENNCIAVSPAP